MSGAPAVARPSAAAAFVGRAAERAALEALIADVRSGAGRALVLSGPPGAGKSALLEQALAGARGVRVLRVTGVESEGELPFAALDAIVRPLLDRLERLPPAQAAALEQALALAARGPAARFAVAAATLSLLAAAAEQQPLLCVIDDAHWIDPASRTALLFAARRLQRESVGIVLAVRAAHADAPDLAGLERLGLPALPDADAYDLLAALGGGHVPRELAEQLVRSADGNPLTLRQLAARLQPGQLEGREAVVGPPPPPLARAENVLADRIAALPERTRAALLLLGASDADETPVLARALAQLGLELADLEPAEAAGLVVLAPGAIGVSHPLVRSVAYHAAPAAERRNAHAAVAAALPEGDLRAPWHAAAAAPLPDEGLAAALQAGAADARRRGGHASAARALRRAAELTPDPARRAQRLLGSADAFAAAGLRAEADAALDRADAAGADPRVGVVRGHLLLQAGRPREAFALLLAQADALEPTDPRAAARALHDAAHAALLLGDTEATRAAAERALPLVPEHDEAARRTSQAMLAVALIAAGEPLRAAPMLAGLREDPAALDLVAERDARAVNINVLLAHALNWLGAHEEAGRLLRHMIEQARAASALAALAYLLGQDATVDLRDGRLAAAMAKAEESLALGEALEHGVTRTGALSVRAGIGAMLGTDAQAEADAQRVLELAGETAPRLAVFGHHALGLLALGRGDIDDAVRHLDAAVAAHGEAGITEPASKVWVPDHLEALIRSGQVERAEPLLAGWERDGERLRRPFVQATGARVRGLLVADAALHAHFARALELHDRLGMPLERARTLLAYGERLRRARRRVDARAPLREALEAFEQAGAAHFARRARIELRATGGMVPAVSRPETAELTPHELQVALMAAEGRTNREIAAALFLAPKTIEHHLSTIFRKLGIKRRAELGRVFADELAQRG